MKHLSKIEITHLNKDKKNFFLILNKIIANF